LCSSEVMSVLGREYSLTWFPDYIQNTVRLFIFTDNRFVFIWSHVNARSRVLTDMIPNYRQTNVCLFILRDNRFVFIRCLLSAQSWVLTEMVLKLQTKSPKCRVQHLYCTCLYSSECFFCSLHILQQCRVQYNISNCTCLYSSACFFFRFILQRAFPTHTGSTATGTGVQ